MKSQAWRYINTKTLLQLMALTTTQQLIVALGTFALAKAGFAIQMYSVFLAWIGIGFAIHILSPFFGLILRPLEVCLTFQAYRQFLDEKLISKSATPSIWPQKSRKEIYLTSIGSETDSYLAALIYVALDVFSFLLSLVLGVCVLGFIIDKTLIPAFVASGVLSFFAYRILERQVKEASFADQEGRTEVASFLLQSWENIFFKNKSVIDRYSREFHKRMDHSQKNSVRATKWSESLVVILSTLSAMPVVLTLLWIAQKNQFSPSLLTALLATIPRQLGMLSTFRSIFQSVASFISFESKFQTLLKNSDLQEETLEVRVRAREISLQGASGFEMNELMNSIQKQNQGRLQVRGPNGIGKSTFLLHLNDRLEASFYLPSNPHFFLDEDTENKSTGQKIMQHIRFIKTTPAKYVLLDEWDANLDDANRVQVNELLEELSKDRVIVEVRHRA